jgi:CRISPR/Cas system-associated endoribonuclease Cas2
MLLPIHVAHSPHLAVLAYDIGCSRRARRVRGVLGSLHHAKQYSVFEVLLGEGQLRGVLAELSLLCDLSEDLLAVWRPRNGVRLQWADGRLIIGARDGQPYHIPARVPTNTGNFVICYDISDPDALGAVAGEIAPETAMVQRSVYWLRGPVDRLSALLARCASYLADGDRLWAYPLRGSHDLWRLGTQDYAILPISTHRWSKSWLETSHWS